VLLSRIIFNSAPARGNNFDDALAASVPATAPSLQYTNPTFLEQTKLDIKVGVIFSSNFMIEIV
jgi:hypothetical protein